MSIWTGEKSTLKTGLKLWDRVPSLIVVAFEGGWRGLFALSIVHAEDRNGAATGCGAI
jgi:hypothetical protein